MKFADDIALGNFTSTDLDDLVDEDDYSGRGQRTTKVFSGFQLSFAISVILHFGLASTLFYFVASDIGRIEELVPASIKVEFVPSNPLLSQTEEYTPETPSESAVPLPLAESQAESNQAGVPEVSESEIAEVTPARNSNANSLQPMETVTLPSMESVLTCAEQSAAQ